VLTRYGRPAPTVGLVIGVKS